MKLLHDVGFDEEELRYLRVMTEGELRVITKRKDSHLWEPQKAILRSLLEKLPSHHPDGWVEKN